MLGAGAGSLDDLQIQLGTETLVGTFTEDNSGGHWISLSLFPVLKMDDQTWFVRIQALTPKSTHSLLLSIPVPSEMRRLLTSQAPSENVSNK